MTRFKYSSQGAHVSECTALYVVSSISAASLQTVEVSTSQTPVSDLTDAASKCCSPRSVSALSDVAQKSPATWKGWWRQSSFSKAWSISSVDGCQDADILRGIHSSHFHQKLIESPPLLGVWKAGCGPDGRCATCSPCPSCQWSWCLMTCELPWRVSTNRQCLGPGRPPQTADQPSPRRAPGPLLLFPWPVVPSHILETKQCALGTLVPRWRESLGSSGNPQALRLLISLRAFILL